VLADWRTEQARADRRAEAQAMAEAVAAGGALSVLAEEAGLAVNQIGPLRRGDPDPRLGPTIRDTLFDAEIGATGIAPVPGGIGLVVLREISDPAMEGEGVRAIEGALAQTLAQDQLEYLGRALETQAGVSINRQTIDSVLAQIGG
jgi:peptidyl-prolyl cis-trans isomerase D